MSTFVHPYGTPGKYANKNLQKASFKDKDLRHADFSGSDLRGVDFTGANLAGADFHHARTGITPMNTVLIFLAALIVSGLSGYVAMLAGHTIQTMLHSPDPNIRTAGITTIVIIIAFILFSTWKGVGHAARQLVLPAIAVSLLVGTVAYVSGMGTGMGMIHLMLSLLLVVVMFVVGTIARAAAGSLSANLLFIVVALGGGIFGKSLGGGIGTVIMALSCAIISKRALSGAGGFAQLKKIAAFITARFGTSFRGAVLANANFSKSRLRNADFSNADLSSVTWGDSKRINCIPAKDNFTTKKT